MTINRNKAAGRYVDLLTDAGFKAVFGGQRNKDILIDLINILLPAHRKVADVRYLTNEIPGFTPTNKSVRVDLICECESGEQKFIVEVQNYEMTHFFKRCVDYACKVYDMGSRLGDREYDMPPVYLLGLVGVEGLLKGHDSDFWRGRYLSEYTFREKLTHEEQEETIFLIFAEVHRFDKPLKECESMLDKWMFVLKNMGRLERLPQELKMEVFERVFAACEVARFEPEVKLEYEKDMITEKDYYNIIDTAHQKGLDQGLAEGRAEGRAEGYAKATEELARVMKASGMPLDQIAGLTGLSREQIAAL